MSGDIGPGDVVMCVDASPHRSHNAPPALKQGACYRVSEVTPTGGLVLRELLSWPVPTGYRWWAWHPDRFRKLNDGEDDAELIARIKGRSPVRIGEPA